MKDQDIDGVSGEVLYGILGAAGKLNDPEAADFVRRLEFLARMQGVNHELEVDRYVVGTQYADAVCRRIARVR